MIAEVTLKIKIPEGSCDSHCDAEHLIVHEIESVINNSENVDEIFQKLQVNINYK